MQLWEVAIDPDVDVAAHAHEHDEVIFVTDGALRFGAQECPVGTAVFVQGGSLYGFQAGPTGATFLNFRAHADRTYIPKAEYLAASRTQRDRGAAKRAQANEPTNVPTAQATPLTRGAVHHVAYIVTDADAAAQRHAQTFGWQRYLDTRVDATTAERIGRLVGLDAGTVESAHVVMLKHPDRSQGTIEFCALVAVGGQPVDPTPIPTLVSYHVDDAAVAYDRLLADGHQAICPPVQLDIAGGRPVVATVRTPESTIIEVFHGLDEARERSA
jgi:hypothetical protein